jgi:hypothetical protein
MTHPIKFSVYHAVTMVTGGKGELKSFFSVLQDNFPDVVRSCKERYTAGLQDMLGYEVSISSSDDRSPIWRNKYGMTIDGELYRRTDPSMHWTLSGRVAIEKEDGISRVVTEYEGKKYHEKVGTVKKLCMDNRDMCRMMCRMWLTNCSEGKIVEHGSSEIYSSDICSSDDVVLTTKFSEKKWREFSKKMDAITTSINDIASNFHLMDMFYSCYINGDIDGIYCLLQDV